MIIYNEKVDRILSKLLLRDLVFINSAGKILKKGQLVLFKKREFYYVFLLKTEKGSIKEYEMPYPFKITKQGNNVVMDYTLKEFAQGDDMVYFKSKVINKPKKNKLYNYTVVLSAL
jgi:hypothetical protein